MRARVGVQADCGDLGVRLGGPELLRIWIGPRCGRFNLFFIFVFLGALGFHCSGPTGVLVFLFFLFIPMDVFVRTV